MSEKMKAKVITMMYSWTVSLPHEAKICEAYHLLKSQGERVARPTYILTEHWAQIVLETCLSSFQRTLAVCCCFLGIVLADPEIPRDATLTAPPSPQPKNPVFDDERKSKVRVIAFGCDC